MELGCRWGLGPGGGSQVFPDLRVRALDPGEGIDDEARDMRADLANTFFSFPTRDPRKKQAGVRRAKGKAKAGSRPRRLGVTRKSAYRHIRVL